MSDKEGDSFCNDINSFINAIIYGAVKIKGVGTLWAEGFNVGGEVGVEEKELFQEYKNHTFSRIWLPDFKKYHFKPEEDSGWVPVKVGNEYTQVEFDKKTGKEEYITGDIPFKNYNGKAFLYLEKQDDSEKKEVIIEVVSEKLKNCDKDPRTFYPVLFLNLVDKISEKFRTLPFTMSAPVFQGLNYIEEPSNPLSRVFFFLNEKDLIKSALDTIAHNPHKRLIEREEFVNIDKVSYVDEDVLMSILTETRYLYEDKTSDGVIPYEGKKYTPLKVKQPVRYETFDTKENRFVKYFAGLMARDIVEIIGIEEEGGDKDSEDEDKKNKKNEKKGNLLLDKLRELKAWLFEFNSTDWMDEVGEMQSVPVYSTVLRMRKGYKELFGLYAKYLFSVNLDSLLTRWINMRDMPNLYELWVALEIAEKIFNYGDADKKGSVKIEIFVNTDEIPNSLTLKVKDSNKKIFEYQGKFGGDNNDIPYTPINLRPDFVFYDKDRKPCVILDAKFGRESASDNSDDKPDDKPNENDIVKMHAYRDALKVKACYIVYPYNFEPSFYSVSGKADKAPLTIEGILNAISGKGDKEIKEGVGWFRMVPQIKQGGNNGKEE